MFCLPLLCVDNETCLKWQHPGPLKKKHCSISSWRRFFDLCSVPPAGALPSLAHFTGFPLIATSSQEDALKNWLERLQICNCTESQLGKGGQFVAMQFGKGERRFLKSCQWLPRTGVREGVVQTIVRAAARTKKSNGIKERQWRNYGGGKNTAALSVRRLMNITERRLSRCQIVNTPLHWLLCSFSQHRIRCSRAQSV
ncbi:hypothetical protein CEXT_540081 [Caerostris extrusa]|uniref:Uncharacterized protein n=1 Tax=Caerostris extrusa TaxID=172846 RepID=A0AAV4T2Y9_CAEEX|nr:hypothetical protein CEXT_540081 [Caerostris extrusa]